MVQANIAYGRGVPTVTVLRSPVIASRAPAASDQNYAIGQLWLYRISASSANWYIFAGVNQGSAIWNLQAATAGDIVTLSDTSGTLITPDANGNVQIAGTSGQITSTAGANKDTLSLPSAITAPGSLTTTTTLTGGTGVTATTGNITATNGNIVRGTAGNKDVYTSVASTTTAGANSAGTVTLVGGTATIATTAVTAASQIRLYRQGVGATGAAALGHLTLGTKSAGVSFIINSVQAADATALQASDVSVVGWEIVN